MTIRAPASVALLMCGAPILRLEALEKGTTPEKKAPASERLAGGWVNANA